MNVVVAPDSFKGTLSALEAAVAIAEGWSSVRPRDRVRRLPLSDGGDGLLEVLAGRDAGARLRDAEVVGPAARPVEAAWLLRADGVAVIESARACGLALVEGSERDPLTTTTWGVGELLEEARRAGATRVLVGVGGSATVDGGAGALCGLGFRLRVADGSGLKIGGGELHRVAEAAPAWVAEEWSDIDVEVLCDVRTTLLDAPRLFGPQKGADEEAITRLEEGLARWAQVAERDLTDRRLRDVPGSGAAGGLSFGLAAGLDARLEPGAERVAEEVGFAEALREADLVVTGEGGLDATSYEGKVVGQVLERAGTAGVPVAAVVGREGPDREGPERDTPPGERLAAVAVAGGRDDPGAAVVAAARRLARRW